MYEVGDDVMVLYINEIPNNSCFNKDGMSELCGRILRIRNVVKHCMTKEMYYLLETLDGKEIRPEGFWQSETYASIMKNDNAIWFDDLCLCKASSDALTILDVRNWLNS